MPIVKFAFEDELRGWKLTETAFSPFNLLVGGSGVGKTKILKSLERVRLAALEGAGFAAGCKWSVEVEAEGSKYLWEARTGKINDVPKKSASSFDGDDEGEFETEPARFVEEKIRTQDGVELVARDTDRFILGGGALPKIKETESAIGLLGNVKELSPLHRALYSIRSIRTENLRLASYDSSTILEPHVSNFESMEELREASYYSVFARAWFLQRNFQSRFAAVVAAYRDIFDQVEDVRVGSMGEFGDESHFPHQEFSDRNELTFAIRERGVETWLTHRRISGGMLRTLVHLLELELASTGTVILIDEFENSLGVNCLPQVAEHILDRADELQFIITSHHPYVINNVPASMWRVVTREGSTVRVLGLEDLPALATASKHERFTILSNLPEFEHGIR